MSRGPRSALLNTEFSVRVRSFDLTQALLHAYQLDAIEGVYRVVLKPDSENVQWIGTGGRQQRGARQRARLEHADAAAVIAVFLFRADGSVIRAGETGSLEPGGITSFRYSIVKVAVELALPAEIALLI